MPPKPKFTKDEVIAAAIKITVKEGIEKVSARSIAKELNTTQTPLFTLFNNMDEIKREVYMNAKTMFMDYMNESLNYDLPFKEYGLRFVLFAQENTNLFKLLFAQKDSMLAKEFYSEFDALVKKMFIAVQKIFNITEIEAKKVTQCLYLQVEGMTTQILTKNIEYSKVELLNIFGTTCLGIVNLIKIKNGSFNINEAKAMSFATDVEPKKIR